jgi:hypothetical protein
MRNLYHLLFFLCSTAFAQELATSKDSLEHEKFLTLCNANREQSYITFGQGIGNLEPLLFEARLSPSFFFSNRQKSWAVMLNPQVIVRMQNRESFPINSPSYKAHLTYFHSIDILNQTFLKKILYDNSIWFASISHHSNGEAGEFYLKDTTTQVIDVEDGSFSTDFLSFGISTFKVRQNKNDMNAFQSAKAFIEIHPRALETIEIKHLYGNYRIFASWATGGPWRLVKKTWVNKWLQNSGIELQAGWVAGKITGTSPVDARARLILDFKYNFYPPWFDEIAFFVRFYRGQDYYNIYFTNTAYNVSFGLTSNIMNLKQAVKTLGRKR